MSEAVRFSAFIKTYYSDIVKPEHAIKHNWTAHAAYGCPQHVRLVYLAYLEHGTIPQDAVISHKASKQTSAKQRAKENAKLKAAREAKREMAREKVEIKHLEKKNADSTHEESQ
jgi:hypothetical protein